MSKVESSTPKLYDLFSPSARANPYPIYAQLRAEEPVYWSPQLKSWFVTRYADVLSGLRHPKMLPFASSKDPASLARLPAEVRQNMVSIGDVTSKWLLFLPSADHRQMRRLMNQGFKPRLVADLRPRIQSIADELIDGVEDSGQMEVMQDFAYPLPAMVIAEMLGVPTSDRDLLKAWSQKMATFFSLTKKGDPAVIESMAQTLLELTDYLREIVRQRRQVPQDDMISNLLAADEEGNILTEEELLSNCVLMLFAGHETTMNLIGNGLLALQRHPEQYEKLKRNPALGAMAVEELLRYDSPVQFLARVAMADLAFGGKQIRAGERITFALGAANRDPAQFSAPDKLELSRQKNKHLTFGYGTHFCLGASLARLEAEIAFNTLLRRLPRLQLATETVTWRSGFQLRGLTSLPVTFKN
jgi:cytochrome P450